MIQRIALITAYVLSIPAATWAVERFGVVPIGFGFYAPAAVYVVGLTLVLRDLIQRIAGKRVAVALIVVGALLSALISPALALASGVAFLISELVDLAVYTGLQRARVGLYAAIVGSNVVSAGVDSVIFLTIAFGNLEFLPGQWIGKLAATVLAVAVLAAFRYERRVPATA